MAPFLSRHGSLGSYLGSHKANDGNLDPGLELQAMTAVHDGTIKQQHGRGKLGWIKLTIVMLVEAIALGAFNIPQAFERLGMVFGTILTPGIGLVAMFTSYIIGQVKLKHPKVKHYADMVELIWGRRGYHLAGIMFPLFLTLLTGSHALTGTIAFDRIVNKPGVCAMVYSAISAVILFLFALPKTFDKFAIFGYLDFGSVMLAIGITIFATGIEANQAPGGLGAVPWSVWLPEDATVSSVLLAATNICFAYSFGVCQPSFMDEMHTPEDYVKSISALGVIEIIVYTVSGALIYAFVGNDVDSPALLSAGFLMSRIVFGIAIPVIYISGSINSIVVGKYIEEHASKYPQFVRLLKNFPCVTWIALIAVITLIGWLVAEAIPFFEGLLGIISSTFISGKKATG